MRLLNSDLSWFHRSTHGYFLAKKYFLGKYKREVFLTIYDPKMNESCYAYLFICEENILISIVHTLSDEKGIYEIEPSDKLTLIEDESMLNKVINSDRAGEKYANISTLNKICFVGMNDKYLFLINIQSGRIYYPTIVNGAFAIKYLTKHDYIEKVNNLILLIKRVVGKENISFDAPLHGLSSFVSIINIYLGIILFTIISGIFIFNFVR